MRVHQKIALTIFIVAVLSNQWVLAWIFSEDGVITQLYRLIFIWLFQSISISLAILLYKDPVKFKTVFRNLLIVMVTGIFCCILLEGLLRSGWFDGLDNPRPVWIPKKYKKADDNFYYGTALPEENSHPFSFRDSNWSVIKPPGKKRIAVLGDSFIWGHGIPKKDIWSQILRKKINETDQNIEVLSWGRNFWSTNVEFDFLKTHGYKYDIDLLIVGFVTNDPDFRNITRYDFTWQNNPEMKLPKLILPNLFDFSAAHLNNLLQKSFFKHYGYQYWENQLYSSENLDRYDSLLSDFQSFCTKNNINLLFVFTPSSYHPSFNKKYSKIIPILNRNNIEYLNLYSGVHAKFKRINPRTLWANPANGHPGRKLNEFYANEVHKYLYARSFNNSLFY